MVSPLIVVLALSTSASQNADVRNSADVYPPVQYDVRVFSHNADGDLTVGNNTGLCLSASITAMGEEAEVLQRHVTPDAQWMTDPDVIGPQGSILRGLWESTKEYAQPHGRNCFVEVITCGGVGRERLSGAELALHDALFQRTVVDQIVIPIIVNVLGMVELKDRAKLNALRKIVKGALAHNTKVIEDFKYEIYDKGSTAGGFSMIANWLWREVENGGLAGDFVLDGLHVSIKKRFEAWAARRAIANIHPWLRTIDAIHKVIDYGPDVVQVAKTIDDLWRTPSKLQFKVYFRTGVDDISPRFVRVGSVDHQFVVSGYHMFPADGIETRVAFSDRRGRPLYEANPDWVLPNGSQLQVTVPNSVLQTAQWPIKASVIIGIEPFRIPGEIRLFQEMEGFSLSPAKAKIGQPIRVLGPSIDPYYLSSEVYFGTVQKSKRKRAVVERIAQGYIAITVPSLDSSVAAKDWRVWVEESVGGRNRSSRLLPFELLPGTWQEETAGRRESEMREFSDEFSGVLSRQTPVGTHDFTVDGGMQVVVTIPSSYGSLNNRGSVIDGFKLSLVEKAADGSERVVPVTDPVNGITGPQPTTTLQHTTDGSLRKNTYRVELRYGQGEPIEYKLKYETKRVDDCSSGEDAPQPISRAKLIHSGERYVGRLYGEQLKYREDVWDSYLVPNVQRGQKIRVQLNEVTGSAPFNNSNTALRAVYLYFVSNGQAQTVASWTDPIRPTSKQVEIFHEDPVPGDYVVSFRHMSGNVQYWFKVDVGYDYGPSLDQAPIVSRFNQGVVEGWKIGSLDDPPSDPTHQTTAYNGYASSYGIPEARRGPLDIALVIDRTGSMGSVIGAVKNQARQIVQALAHNSADMRLGLVSFTDIEAEGANARKLYPLSPQVQQQLDALQSWTLGGGGDEPEDVLHGLRGALDMAWRDKGARDLQVGKAIVVITDNPAKLKDGKDANGNTLDSIVQDARAKGIQIFPVMMAQEPTLAQHANTLAVRTGGQVVDWSTQSQVVETLASVAAQAVERSMPRYWIAPGRFHGDMTRFYGRSLSFELASRTTPKGFDSDDVILTGGGLTFTLRSSSRPEGSPTLKTGWTRTTVPLSTVGYWSNRATGQRPTLEEWLKLLASVDGLKIRGEYFAGPDECSLDNVEFGTSRHPNDRGLSDQGKRDTAMVRDAIEAMQNRWALYAHTTDIVENGQWLRNWAKSQGLPEDAMLGLIHTELLLAVKRPDQFSVQHYLRDEPQRQLRGWLERIRVAGQLSDEERTSYGAGIRSWNERMRQFDEVRRDMEFNVQMHARAMNRYLQGAPIEREMNRSLMATHEQAIKALVPRMRALAYKSGLEPP